MTAPWTISRPGAPSTARNSSGSVRMTAMTATGSISKRCLEDATMERTYLDHAAAPPARPEVVEAMLPYFQERFGNPSAVYDLAVAIKDAIEEQRARVAELIGAPGDSLLFTACGG